MNSGRRLRSLSWVEVDAKALRHNVQALKSNLAVGCGLVPVVKANAYGHGYLEVSRLLDSGRFAFLAVHNLQEAFILRDGGIKTPILIMGYVPLSDLKEAVTAGFDFVVYNTETMHKLIEFAENSNPARCHLKLETGTNRQGISSEQLPEILELFRSHDQLLLAGLSTHFANIEDTTDHTYADMQYQRYVEMKKQVEASGMMVKYAHMASSAATLLFPHTHFNLTRAGIALYGLWPSKETYVSYRQKGGNNQLLDPVLSWKTMIAQIKEIRKGEYVGYGTTYRATADSRIAVIPIGYFDGYDRQISNQGHVLVNGMRAPVRGRICMDIFMVDVTDIPDVGLESEVVLIGKSGEECVRAEDIAMWAQTINYEVVARIGPHLERRVIHESNQQG